LNKAPTTLIHLITEAGLAVKVSTTPKSPQVKKDSVIDNKKLETFKKVASQVDNKFSPVSNDLSYSDHSMVSINSKSPAEKVTKLQLDHVS